MSAEAMREAAAMIVDAEAERCVGCWPDDGDEGWMRNIAAAIRAIPIPPDPARDELLAALKRYHPDTAPKGARVLIAGGVARKLTGGQWVSCMMGPDDECPLNWTPKWWAHIPTDNDAI